MSLTSTNFIDSAQGNDVEKKRTIDEFSIEKQLGTIIALSIKVAKTS